MVEIRLGAFPPLEGPVPAPGTQARFAHAAADAGLDHVCTGDHVSFFVGAGFDGLCGVDARTRGRRMDEYRAALASHRHTSHLPR